MSRAVSREDWRDSGVHRLAKRILPSYFYPRNVLARQIVRRSKGCVYSGPFQGMRYAADSVGSVYYPKLLGTYEKELHPIMERIASLDPELIVDVGAAEGYYAVGLAMRLPRSHVVAYEMDAQGRRHLNEMAELNGVTERVVVRGKCETADLHQTLASNPRAVVICDVEGYEAELLCGPAAPDLSRTWLLVEVHEFAVPGVGARLSTALAATHVVEQVWQRPRTREDYPFRHWMTRLLPAAYASYQVQEFRPERMSWLWATPRIESR